MEVIKLMALTSLDNSGNHARFTTTAVAANGLNSSDAFSVGPYSAGTIQVVWANHSDNSTFQLEVSNDDGAHWDSLPGSSVTTSGASGSASLVFNDHLPGHFLRVTLTEADGSGSATLTPYFVGKRGR